MSYDYTLNGFEGGEVWRPEACVVTLYIAQILFFPSQSPFTGMFMTKTEDWQGGYGRVVE